MKKGVIAPIVFLIAVASPSIYRLFGPPQERNHLLLNVAIIVCFLGLAVVIAIVPSHPVSKSAKRGVAKGATDR